MRASRHLATSSLARNHGTLLARILRWIAICRGRARERRHLMEMNDVQLKDLGLSRWEAAREAEKPFWRP